MKNAPLIQSAIPVRRYRLSDFELVILGDIKTEGDIDFRHLLAVIPTGESEPVLYVSYQTSADDPEPHLAIITEQEVRHYVLTQELHEVELFIQTGIETVQRLFQIDPHEEAFQIG